MSHTDKDRPYWVVRHTENFPIDHDHKAGVCTVETAEYARLSNAGAFKGHRHDCLKRVTYEYYCTEAEPYRSRYRYHRWHNVKGWARPNGRPDPEAGREDCWGTWDEPVWAYGATYASYNGHFARRTKKNGCLGPHKRIEHVDTIPCVCNGWPPVPTCSPSWHGEAIGWKYSHYATNGCSKSEWCKVYYHGPERQRERVTLTEQAKEYNANGDLADWDYFNRQGRRSVHWDMY